MILNGILLWKRILPLLEVIKSGEYEDIDPKDCEKPFDGLCISSLKRSRETHLIVTVEVGQMARMAAIWVQTIESIQRSRNVW